MLKHELPVLKDEDPEELHQMRVGMRRLRSAIAGFTQAITLPKAVTIKKVSSFARQLGELRDIDVQQETLIQLYYPSLPDQEQAVLKDILKALAKKREKIFKNVYQELHCHNYLEFKTTLNQWLEHPQLQAIAVYPIFEVLPDILLPQISDFFLHPGWLVATENQENGQLQQQSLEIKDIEVILNQANHDLHELRKVAKRTRYQMELFADFYGDDYHQLLKQVKLIQEILGEIQDSVVLRHFLQRGLKDQVNLLLPTLMAQLQEHRLQKWSEWQPLQQHFLDPERRSQARTTIQQPTVRPNVANPNP